MSVAADCEVLGDPPPGEVVAGKYRVEARVAIGGMATILRAEHLGLGEHVALKVLLPRYRKSAEFVGRFRREARAVARLRSEHVARVLDFGALADGSPYLAMELLDGQDLEARLLERGPLPQREAVDYVLQACEALAEAHALGIVHRDLKPQNLFLTKAPHGGDVVKVIDFGIAKTIGGKAGITSKHSSMGTPHYMSPEQLRAIDTVDARTDIWALGVILHELLTGRNVFDAPTVSELLMAIVTTEPRLWLEPKHALLEPVIRCCLVPREERFASVRELAEALAPFGTERAAERVERLRRVEEAAKQRAGSPVDDELVPPSVPRPPASSLPTMVATQSVAIPMVSKRRLLAGVVGLGTAAMLVAFAPRSRGDERVMARVAAAPPVVVAPPLPPSLPADASSAAIAPPPPPAVVAEAPRPQVRRAPAPSRVASSSSSASPSAATRPLTPQNRDRFFNTRK